MSLQRHYLSWLFWRRHDATPVRRQAILDPHLSLEIVQALNFFSNLAVPRVAAKRRHEGLIAVGQPLILGIHVLLQLLQPVEVLIRNLYPELLQLILKLEHLILHRDETTPFHRRLLILLALRRTGLMTTIIVAICVVL